MAKHMLNQPFTPLMNRRNLLKNLGLNAIGIACLTPTASASPSLAKMQKPLQVGRTLRYDEGLTIQFLAVLKDDRFNDKFIKPGNASVLLRIRMGKSTPRLARLNTHKDPANLILPVTYPEGMVGIPKSYLVSIESLTPRTREGKMPRQRDYQLTLSIDVAV